MSNSIKEYIISTPIVLVLPILTHIPYIGWIFNIIDTLLLLLGIIVIVQNYGQVKEKALSVFEKVKAFFA